MKPYDPNELCPLCHHDAFTLRADTDGGKPWLSRLCQACGASFRRKPLTDEVPDGLYGLNEYDILSAKGARDDT